MTSTSNQPNTIVLIPGLWLSAHSWEQWVERYQNKGFEVLAHDWPGLEGDIDTVRGDASAVDNIGFGEIVDHFEKIVRALDRPPIIMGHSFGGSVVEMLLDRGVGAVGVAIDPGPVKGVLKLPFAELKSASPGLRNPRNRHRAVTLTPEEFHYAFTNTMTDEESAAVYERYAIPGSGKALFEAAFANFHPHSPTKVDFHNDDRARSC